MSTISPAEVNILNRIEQQLNGDVILFGSHYNQTFEEAFLSTNNKIDQKKRNYLGWVLSSMENQLERHMTEALPLEYVIDAKAVLKHANSVNLTMLIIKRKLAFYDEKKMISYRIHA